MTKRSCPGCGHEHPADARFCMYCGYLLTDGPAVGENPGPDGQPRSVVPADASPAAPTDRGTDWAAILAAFIAFLSLRRMSRQARQTTIIIVLLMMFFGCPMVCGFVAFVMEWFANLFQ